jgi:hypothetical protein
MMTRIVELAKAYPLAAAGLVIASGAYLTAGVQALATQPTARGPVGQMPSIMPTLTVTIEVPGPTVTVSPSADLSTATVTVSPTATETFIVPTPLPSALPTVTVSPSPSPTPTTSSSPTASPHNKGNGIPTPCITEVDHGQTIIQPCR